MSFRDVKRLQEMGYQGLKIIGTRFAYDDPRYFPAYAAAEEFGMPILMHLGVIGGGVDYAITHTRRDTKAAETYQRMTEMGRLQPWDVYAMRMRPSHLRSTERSVGQGCVSTCKSRGSPCLYKKKK